MTQSHLYRAASSGSELRPNQPVILHNGQPATIQYVSRTMNVARVRLDNGKLRTVKLSEVMPVGEHDRPHAAAGGPHDDQDTREVVEADEQGSIAGSGHDMAAADAEADAAAAAEDDDQWRKPEVRNTVERAHPEAGQRPRVEDSVVARAERKIAGPPRPVEADGLRNLGNKDPRSGRPVVQPSNSIDQNERLAAQAAPELDTRLSHLAAGVPGVKFMRLRPQKNPGRLREKIKGESKPPQTISDYLASQVAADSPQAKDQFIAHIKKHFKVVNVDDSFLKGRPEKAGYPSANVQVQLSNGATAEVQIVPKEVQQITDQSHHFYKMGRNARDAGKHALSRHYFQQALAINERALARFRMRNGIRNVET